MTDKLKQSDFSTLLVTRHDNGLVVVTLNRPEVGNAVNTEMGLELLDFWTDLVRNHDGLRCVVLTGAGEDAFCAGGDMKQRKGMSEYEWRHQHEIFEQALWTMMECPVPVIAAVNGKAFGGGLEMILAADFAYGVDYAAKLWFPEVMIGILPGVGGTTTLPRIVGKNRANEIILAGGEFSAAQNTGMGHLQSCMQFTGVDAICNGNRRNDCRECTPGSTTGKEGNT